MNTSTNTNSPPIALAIVGCGAVARECHLPVFLEMPQVRVTVLCDKEERTAHLLNSEFSLNALVTTDVASLKGRTDAALVAVPPRFHAPVTNQLLELGIDVLCEKPLALTAAEGETMARTAARTQRILAVGLMTRFHPNNDLLRDIVADGFLGPLREIVAEYGAPNDWDIRSANYYTRETTGGGIFYDAGVHVLDRLQWLFGSIDQIEFEDDAFNGGYECNALLRGRLCLGVTAIPCRVAISSTHRLNNSIRVIGENAVAEVRLSDPDAVFIQRRLGGRSVEMRVTDEFHKSVGARFNQFRAQAEDFLAAVRTRRPPHVTAESTLGAVRTIEQAYAARKPMHQPWVTTEATR